MVAALCISFSLLACDDRDPIVGSDNNGDQRTEEDEQPTEEDEPRTEEGDQAKLMMMRQVIDALIGDAAGASIDDCRSVAIGSKPCGGPWAYIVYSASSTDPTELANRLAEYNAFEAEMNALYGYVSDCSIPSMPVLVFKDGRCGTE
ncbi:MAG: hypothetical protein F4014_02160 [Gemmatimonadetes bacterium]|nr:hypothetical protein [Gemmatimonadota bacterium]MYH20544.1 hypothetical protein [Gemmatimonadota bacterium]MYK97642.1 hypothetical protein [Gemmatimonadota bacterium]